MADPRLFGAPFDPHPHIAGAGIGAADEASIGWLGENAWVPKDRLKLL